MNTSPLNILVAAIAIGVAGAVTVVVFHSVVADALGGAVGLGALALVIRSSLRLASDVGDDDTAAQPS